MKKILQLLTICLFFLGCKKERANQHYQKAFELEENDKYLEAIKELDIAIRIYPEFEQAYLDRAIDKSIIGKFEEAIIDLDKLISMQPKGIEAYVWRAEYKRMLGRYSEALKDAEIALELKDPLMFGNTIVGTPELNYDNPYIKNDNYDIELEYILYERGIANYYIENFEKAYSDLSYCINKDLNTANSIFFRGLSLFSLGDKEKGCEDLLIASKLGLKDADKILLEECQTNK